MTSLHAFRFRFLINKMVQAADDTLCSHTIKPLNFGIKVAEKNVNLKCCYQNLDKYSLRKHAFVDGAHACNYNYFLTLDS